MSFIVYPGFRGSRNRPSYMPLTRRAEAESARQAEIKAWNQRKIMIEGDLAKLQDSEM